MHCPPLVLREAPALLRPLLLQRLLDTEELPLNPVEIFIEFSHCGMVRRYYGTGAYDMIGCPGCRMWRPSRGIIPCDDCGEPMFQVPLVVWG